MLSGVCYKFNYALLLNIGMHCVHLIAFILSHLWLATMCRLIRLAILRLINSQLAAFQPIESQLKTHKLFELQLTESQLSLASRLQASILESLLINGSPSFL